MPKVQKLDEFVKSLTTQISDGIPDGFYLKGVLSRYGDISQNLLPVKDRDITVIQK